MKQRINRKHINPMAPYFVQLRALERQLIMSTLAAALDALPPRASFKDRLHLAAELLGVELPYLRVRCRALGGILPNDPKHEPPMTAKKAWSKEGQPKIKKVKPLAKHDHSDVAGRIDTHDQSQPSNGGG
jgi:hypothetical protein